MTFQRGSTASYIQNTDCSCFRKQKKGILGRTRGALSPMFHGILENEPWNTFDVFSHYTVSISTDAICGPGFVALLL